MACLRYLWAAALAFGCNVGADDCYNNEDTHPWCWRFRAYGSGPVHKKSMGYFIIPVGICNTSGSGKLRYFLEPNLEDWFPIECTDTDFRNDWFCGKRPAESFAQYIKINIRSDKDGLITTRVCAPVQSPAADFFSIDEAGKPASCRDFQNIPANEDPCPPRGFNPALFVFQVELNNEYGSDFYVWEDTIRSLLWIGPTVPSDLVRRELASHFLTKFSSQYVRLRGAWCAPPGWVNTVMLILRLLLDPIRRQPTAPIVSGIEFSQDPMTQYGGSLLRMGSRASQ